MLKSFTEKFKNAILRAKFALADELVALYETAESGIEFSDNQIAKARKAIQDLTEKKESHSDLFRDHIESQIEFYQQEIEFMTSQRKRYERVISLIERKKIKKNH